MISLYDHCWINITVIRALMPFLLPHSDMMIMTLVLILIVVMMAMTTIVRMTLPCNTLSYHSISYHTLWGVFLWHHHQMGSNSTLPTEEFSIWIQFSPKGDEERQFGTKHYLFWMRRLNSNILPLDRSQPFCLWKKCFFSFVLPIYYYGSLFAENIIFARLF